MFKKIVISIIIFSFLIPKNVLAATPPEITAKAAVLYEPATNTVLYEKNMHEQLPIASVTKVMTILLIYEAEASGQISWDDEVTISEHASSMGGSQIFLEAGEVQTVEDLTKSIVIASANDAAVAMAEYIAGSEEAFVEMMNAKAQELGMVNTHFMNACGLDEPNHYSSAYDVALMTDELITKYPKVLEYSSIWQDSIYHGTEEFVLTNTNKLLKSYPGITGLKTGSTSEAMYCISATAHRDGMDLIAVILGAPDPTTRFNEAAMLLDYGFANYQIVYTDEVGKVVGTIPVQKGEVQEAEITVGTHTPILLPKGESPEITTNITVDEYVIAPVEAGTKVGEISYYVNGVEVGKSDLIIAESIEKASLKDTMEHLRDIWL